MNGLAPRMPGAHHAGDIVAQRIGVTRQAISPAYNLRLALDWEQVDGPGPQTESSVERGFRLRGPVDDEWGRSESLDPDNVGDIADEGMGHRG